MVCFPAWHLYRPPQLGGEHNKEEAIVDTKESRMGCVRTHDRRMEEMEIMKEKEITGKEREMHVRAFYPPLFSAKMSVNGKNYYFGVTVCALRGQTICPWEVY